MKTVLTGIRPTGALHLGHYVGALQQWIPLQYEGYECFFLIADIQALTTHADRPALIEESVREVVLDWLAVGLDPTLPNVHFFRQSQVLELHELTTYLTMVTPMGWMEANPTIKEEKARLKGKMSVGFGIYVTSQAADILLFSPDPNYSREKILVPVGEDQAPHLRDTNRIAHAFNRTYGKTLVPCKPLIGEIGRLVGTDNDSKMGKSQGNAIFLGESEDAVTEKVRGMYTDPNRKRATDPGTVENNPIFIYHNAFNSNRAEVLELEERYRAGKVGDVEVKQRLARALNEFLDPIRERRAQAERFPIYEYLEAGEYAARMRGQETLARVRDAMHLNYRSFRR